MREKSDEFMELKQLSDAVWELPQTGAMTVPGRIYATKPLIDAMDPEVVSQLRNAAALPGLLKYAMAMPDCHAGYGLPIGGVTAFDLKDGVISPGMIGFDINCGMRAVKTNLKYFEVAPKIKEIVDLLHRKVPAGVGSSNALAVTNDDMREILATGSSWALNGGYAWASDLELTEENGRMRGADPDRITQEAVNRGINQVGTLGSGNHYLEIQRVREENLFDRKAADALGLFPDQVVVMFHCGSRGLGHQTCTDYTRKILPLMEGYGISVSDRELASVPFSSQEGQEYLAAMRAAINFAFVNRQVILHSMRSVFSEAFHKTPEELGMEMIYDVAHNTGKVESHTVDGARREVFVHRKGATRAFGSGRDEVPSKYNALGQPVIIGGSMQTGSYILLGTKGAELETFGSTAHGSGRTMSRTKARQLYNGRNLQEQMLKDGIYVKSDSLAGLAEESGGAYKDVDAIIEATEIAGISKKVVRLSPFGNLKG